jgi:hypothetical protein
LVLVLSLALVSGNAHAALNLDDLQSGPCPEEHHHHHAAALDEAGGSAVPHEPGHHDDNGHHHDKGHGCCCECLGCTAAADVVPGFTLTPGNVPLGIHFGLGTASLDGLALGPELDPPRPAALI